MLLQIMREKIILGWDFEKIYRHLLVLDDFQKINKGVLPNTNQDDMS